MGFPARLVERLAGGVFALAVLAVAAGTDAAAASVNVLQSHPDALGRNIQVYQEPSGPIDVGAAAKAFSEGRGHAGDNDTLTFGIGPRPVWLRLAVENPGGTPVRRRLSVETAWLDYVDIHFLRAGAVAESHRTGDALPFADRPIRDRFFAVDHVFAPGATEILIRVETGDPMVVPVYLSDREGAEGRKLFQGYSYGVIYGGVLALLLYNLMLYLGARDPRYLFYSLYLFGFLAMNSSYTGHAYQWIWSESPIWERWSNPTLMLTFSIGGIVFGTQFLGTKVAFPRLHRGLLGTCAAFVVALLACIAIDNQKWALLVAFVFLFVFSGGMLILGIASFLGGNRSARFFLLAALAVTVSATWTGFVVWGLMPYSVAAYHAIELGMLADAILLALALADRLRLAQEGRQNAERMAGTDPLTGLANRRAFLDQVGAQWERGDRRSEDRGSRRRRNAAVMVLDVDHFKRVNDNFGHVRGDEVLVRVAQALRQGVRGGDVVARWGGEEFVVFLPETSLLEAVSMAERIRKAISGIVMDRDGRELRFTASFGVAHSENPSDTLEGLIESADRQLYEAKDRGRNRVCSRLAA